MMQTVTRRWWGVTPSLALILQPDRRAASPAPVGSRVEGEEVLPPPPGERFIPFFHREECLVARCRLLATEFGNMPEKRDGLSPPAPGPGEEVGERMHEAIEFQVPRKNEQGFLSPSSVPTVFLMASPGRMRSGRSF